jgi:hypothetical protein
MATISGGKLNFKMHSKTNYPSNTYMGGFVGSGWQQSLEATLNLKMHSKKVTHPRHI